MAQKASPAYVKPSPLLADPDEMALDKINKLKAPLIAIGVPENIFNEDVYLAVGCFPRNVASYLKLFTAYPDLKKLVQVLNIGITNGMFNAISDLTARTFFNFSDFLRSRAGQNELTKIARHNRLLKRTGGEMSARDVALLKLFELQGAQMAKAVADANREYDAKIKEAELELDQARRMRDEFIESFNEECAPHGTYKKYCMRNITGPSEK